VSTVWLHTHLPRLRAGDPCPISVKVPGERIQYASWVSVQNARFVVHERGRQRCVRDGVRNVHAWVVGDEILRVTVGGYSTHFPKAYRRAVYDPFKGPAFVDSETLQPVHSAALVIMAGKNVYYAPAGE
jgi:hypothetical protein